MARRVVLQNTGMNSTKYGSLEHYLLRVAQVCRERGYDTVMQYEAHPASEEYTRELRDAGVEIVVTGSRGSAIASAAACARLVAGHRPSVIHNHFIGKVWQATVPVVGRVAGSKVLVTSVHNDKGYQGPSKDRLVYNQYHHVLPVSAAVRASLEKAGVTTARLQTHYLGLLGERQRDEAAGRELRRGFGLPPDATVLGCIAWSAPFKGVDLLLHALKEVLEKHERVFLLQVGVEAEAVELRGLSRELGVADNVVWAGVVDDGWRMLNATDVYVQPSRSFEGLPLALMEAMAMGMPIVSTRVSGNIEAVIDGETGLVAEPDSGSLAEAINDLLDRPEDWVRLGTAAQQRYRDLFDGEASVEKLVSDVYGIRDA